MAASSTSSASVVSISPILTRTAIRRTRSAFTLLIMRSCTLRLCAFQVVCLLLHVSASCQSFSDIIGLFVPHFWLDSLTSGGFILEVWSPSFLLHYLPGLQPMAKCAAYKTYEHTIDVIQELRLSIAAHAWLCVIPVLDDGEYFFCAKSTHQVFHALLVSDIGPLAYEHFPPV